MSCVLATFGNLSVRDMWSWDPVAGSWPEAPVEQARDLDDVSR